MCYIQDSGFNYIIVATKPACSLYFFFKKKRMQLQSFAQSFLGLVLDLVRFVSINIGFVTYIISFVFFSNKFTT